MGSEGRRVEDQLQVHHLQQLMYWFQSNKATPPSSSVNRITQSTVSTPIHTKPIRKRGHLTLQELKLKLKAVLHPGTYDNQVDTLLSRLNITGDGYVDWNEFCTYLLIHLRENDFMRTSKQLPFELEPRIRHIMSNRQETTSKVLVVDNPTKFVTISKTGVMCVWNIGLHEEKSYHVFGVDMEFSTSSDQGQAVTVTGAKRRVREWVTDAIYLSNCHHIAIASTGRDIRFFDTSTSNQFFEEFYLFALPDVPTCFDYSTTVQHSNSESLLIFGDDHGAVHLLYFSKPHIQLFAIPFNKEEGTTKVYFPDLNSHAQFVRYTKLDHPLSDMIRRILYLPDNNSVAIATSDSVNSVVIADVRSKKKSYVFSVAKGVECFDHNKNLNVLATGGCDHLVRLWNPYVTSRPIAILQGHSMSVVDVRIYEVLGQVFSYSRDLVLKVWDIKEQTCLQSVFIKFPISTGVIGRLPEFGPFSLQLHSSSKTILATANDYIAMLKFGRSNTINVNHVTTHPAPLSGVVYNSLLRQVITVADDSTVAMWDLLSGSKSMHILNAHGVEEITAVSLDVSQRKLVTGARNGSIKVWNVQNGHNLHNLEPVDEQEVTGLIAVDDKLVVAVGWSRKIVQYSIESDTILTKANADWKGGQLHHEDILAVDFCPPNTLATASFDGEIAIWSLETETLFKKLKRIRHDHGRQHVAVNKLLFLVSRARSKQTDSATLISSEAGVLRWWSIFGKQQELGSYSVSRNADDSVLGLCTTEDNGLLLCGDTGGHVTIWDISRYCQQLSQCADDQFVQLHCWVAHNSAAIVSIACAENIGQDQAKYVITASTDLTAKLWSIDGTPIGTFGQTTSWNLAQPAAESLNVSTKVSEVANNKEPVDIQVKQENEMKSRETDAKGSSMSKKVEPFNFPKISLGCRVSEQFANIRRDRHDRREHLADIDFTRTNRMRTLCCPYQAVATLPLAPTPALAATSQHNIDAKMQFVLTPDNANIRLPSISQQRSDY